jgi:molecular chaperone DnaK
MADAMVHTAERSLKDAGDKITEDLKKEINDAIAEVKTARAGEDKDAISKATESLSEKMMKIGEAMKTANDTASQESAGTESAQGESETAKDETAPNA